MSRRVVTHLALIAIVATALSACSSKVVVKRVTSPRAYPSTVDSAEQAEYTGNSNGSSTDAYTAANDRLNHSDANTKLKMDGVFYALPRNVIVIEVPLEKRITRPGKFKDFVPFFFPGEEEQAIKETNTDFTMKEPAFSRRAEADPDQIFLVRTRGGALGGLFEDKSLNIDLTEEGVMTKADAQTVDHSLEIGIKALSTFLPIAGRLNVFGGGSSDRDKAGRDCGEDQDFSPEFTEEERAFERETFEGIVKDPTRQRFFRTLTRAERAFYMKLTAESKTNTAIAMQKAFFEKSCRNERIFFIKLDERQRAIYLSLTVEQQRSLLFDSKQQQLFLNLKDKKLDDFEDALRTYLKIRQLLEDRHTRLRDAANASTPPETIKFIVKEIDDQLAEPWSSFFGAKVTRTGTAKIEFLPVMRDINNDRLLFRFSPTKGVCEERNSVRVRLTVTDGFKSDQCTAADAVAVKLEKESGQLADRVHAAVEQPSSTDERAFYYRIPAKVVARLLVAVPATDRADANNGRLVENGESGHTRVLMTEKAHARLLIAQYGITASIPASTGGRRTKYTLSLSDSGAMTNFVLGSDALIDKTMVEDVGKATNEIIDQRQKKKEQADKAADELTQLERESKILELRLKIKEAQQKLEEKQPEK